MCKHENAAMEDKMDDSSRANEQLSRNTSKDGRRQRASEDANRTKIYFKKWFENVTIHSTFNIRNI